MLFSMDTLLEIISKEVLCYWVTTSSKFLQGEKDLLNVDYKFSMSKPPYSKKTILKEIIKWIAMNKSQIMVPLQADLFVAINNKRLAFVSVAEDFYVPDTGVVVT